MLVEVKEPEVSEAVRRVLVEEGAAERCVAASEDARALEAFREPPFASAASASQGAAHAGNDRPCVGRSTRIQVPFGQEAAFP